jgi:hypothetical protein
MKRVALAGLMGVAVFALAPVAQALDKLSCVAAHEAAQEFRQRDLLVQSREQLLLCADPSCPRLVTEECRMLLAELDGPPKRDDADAPAALGGCCATAAPALPRQATPHLPAAVSPPSLDRPPRETPASKEHPPGPSPVTLVPGVLAVAALTGAAYFGWRGLSGADQLSHTCAPGCDPSQVSPIRRQLLMADLSLMAGVGLGALTAWMVWNGRAPETRAAPLTSSRPRDSNGGAGLSLVPGIGALQVEYRGRF